MSANCGINRTATKGNFMTKLDAVRGKASRQRTFLRRTGLGGGMLLGLSALAYGARLTYANRYRQDRSEILATATLDNGRAVIELADGTTLVVSAANWHLISDGAKAGATADYRVNRWSIDGIPAGEIFSAVPGADNEPGTF
jgi:hypothetical protein